MNHPKRLIVVVVLLCAAPARGQSSLDLLRSQAAGFSAPPPPSAVGVSVLPLAAAFSPRLLGAFTPAASPAASVDLKTLLNRHWTSSDSFGSGADQQNLCVQFDRGDNPFVGAAGSGWAHPWFHRLERGMNGRWQAGSHVYGLSLDVSIWRSRLNNRVQVYDETAKKRVYDRTITSLLLSTYWAGQAVSVGGNTYRVFHYNEIKTASGKPYGVDWDLYGVAFVYDEVSGSSHDYKIYRFRREDLVGASPVRAELYGGQVVGLRVAPDFSTLEVYDAP